VPSAHAADIHTARLRLVATTADHLRIELDHPEKLGATLGVQIPEGWPPGLYDQDAMRFFLAKSIEGGDETLGWYGWYAIFRGQRESQSKLVASGGYFGPPTPEGDIEIGYSVVEQERRKGYATELVNALVARALESNSVKRVFAEVHQTNEASIKVLERAGFVRFGPGREEGYWRLLFQGTATSK
jgi:[ribosomal protein S5]-alanine N-acetyltransferase